MSNQSRFSTPDPALAPGTRHAGFVVTSAERVDELPGCAYVMRHEATGARLMWLACEDANRSFCMAFRTPPADDTGVFHILEHSVLSGSRRYPVKEPFVTLLKSSMQTFLNAMTFSDKTAYPVASTNVEDLENLMGVYIDAVLDPAIYERPRTFEQEGWHLEVARDADSPDGWGPLSYNGVVLNEMKGATSDPDTVLYQEVCRALFPDTCYGHESGGAPRAIPALTYEAFLDAHARHYDLSNSYTVLYGDLDVERELAFVGERFSQAPRRAHEDPNPLAEQAPVAPGPRRVRMATAASNASCAMAFVLGTAAERTRVLGADVLLDALCGSNEAPLKRRVLDAGLADDMDAMLVDGVLQPHVVLFLHGLREGAAGRFWPLVREACAELARDGIGRERLEASLAQAEFNLREADYGSADGVGLSVQALSGWLYDDERPLDYVRYEGALAELHGWIDDGGFEALLRDVVCDSAHHAEVELVPVGEGDGAEEAAELAALRATMGPDDLARVAAEVDALRAEQEAPDSPEALATLPRLSPADAGEGVAEVAQREVDAPLPCWALEVPTHGIDYVYHYFGLSRLGYDDLPWVGVLTDLLGKLDTRDHTASELDTAVERSLGSLGFFVETYARDDDPSFADPRLVVAASALGSNVGALAALPAEVWGTTRFDDLGRVRDILTQRRVGLEQYYVGEGHSVALARSGTFFSAASEVADRVSGLGYYLFLRDLLDAWDERRGELPARLEGLCRRVFVDDDVEVSFTGDAADRDAFWGLGGTLGLGASDEPAGPGRMAAPELRPRDEAFVIPSDVSYVVSCCGPTPADAGTPGAWAVAARVLSYDYLWNEVRAKGGAYGAGFRRSSDGIRAMWSYRDPSPEQTLARYEGAAAWLAAWDPTPKEMDGYVVATLGAHDAPAKPRRLGRRQDVARHSGREAGWRDLVRAQELSCTPDDVRALAAALAERSCGRGVCMLGSRAAVEASGVAFDSVTELVRG